MDRQRLRAKVKNARAMKETIQLDGVRRAVIHGLFGGLPPDKFAHVLDMTVDKHVWVDVDAIRRDAALAIHRAQQDQETKARAEAKSRAQVQAAADAVAGAIDEPVFCASGRVAGWGSGEPLDQAAHAFLCAAFADCLSGDRLTPPFSTRIALEFCVGHPKAARTHLVVNMSAADAALCADVSAFDFPSMRPPAFVPPDEAARDAAVRRLVHALAAAAGAPRPMLSGSICVRLHPPGAIQ